MSQEPGSVETRTIGSTRADSVDAPEREPIDVGSKLGRYVVARTLGAGGMGVVYAAYDPDLDRKVALKLLRYDASGSAESRTRMMREAQAMARIASPNVVAVFDVGSVRDQVYIAMELLGGTTLRGWLNAAKRSWREVVTVMVRAGRGLADAHRKGLIHRDFKPDNVLVDGTRACVADFGVAAARDAPPRNSFLTLDTPPPELERSLTAVGTLVGTPAYMSPEQLEGEPADARSDQYSFGVALYEALYGQRPFGDVKTAAALLAAMHEGKVRPPHGPPHWLRSVVARALAVSPAARYPSMDELLADLESGLARRRRVILASGALGVVALVVALAVFARDLTARPDDPCARAAVPADVDLDASALRGAFVAARPGSEPSADHVATRTAAWRGEVGELRGRTCRAARVEATESPELFDLRMACIARSVRDVRALADAMKTPSPGLVDGAYEAIDHATDLSRCRGPRATLASFAGPALPTLRDRLAAARTLDAAGRWFEAASAADDIATAAASAHAYDLEAEADQLAGEARTSLLDREAARDSLRKALIASESIDDAHLRITLYLDMVRIEDVLRHIPEVGQWAAQARALADHVDDAAVRWQVLLGQARYDIDHREEAGVTTMSAAIAAHRAVAPDEDLDDVSLLIRLADAQIGVRRYQDALASSQHAVDLADRLVGTMHPSVSPALVQLALVYLYLNDAKAALAAARRSAAIAEATAGPASRLDDAYHVLGLALTETHQPDEAAKVFAKALAASTDKHGMNYAYLLADHGYNLLELHRYDEAIEVGKAAVDIARREIGPDTSDTARFLYLESHSMLAAGKLDDARKLTEEELRIYSVSVPADAHAAEADLAEILRAQKHLDDALVHAERALELADTDLETANAKVEVGTALVGLHRDAPRATQLLHEARDILAPRGDTDAVKTIDELLAGLGAK